MAYTDKKIYTDDYVTLEPVRHIYTDKDGNRYESVSKLLSRMEVPFDRDGISKSMAKRRLPKSASIFDVANEQRKILAEWDQKRDNSVDIGNHIHDNLEKYFLSGTSDDDKITDLGRKIKADISYGVDYKRMIPEKVFYDIGNRYAGSADLPGIRKESRSTPWILDIFDYKTNIEQGIRFDSIDRRKTPPRHYDRYYVGDFSHIESCNYYKYAMQLSMYAYFAMNLYNVRIGRLGIIFVNENLEHKIFPVPFMYYEVIALINMIKSMKKLPQEEKRKNKEIKEKAPMLEAQQEKRIFDFYNDSDF